MASTRTITVGGIPYLQVVDYKKTREGKAKIDVIKSFGKESIENRMRADQFTASYNKLKEIAERGKGEENPRSLLGPALAIFGIVLGTAIVVTVLGVGLGDD